MKKLPEKIYVLIYVDHGQRFLVLEETIYNILNHKSVREYVLIKAHSKKEGFKPRPGTIYVVRPNSSYGERQDLLLHKYSSHVSYTKVGEYKFVGTHTKKIKHSLV